MVEPPEPTRRAAPIWLDPSRRAVPIWLEPYPDTRLEGLADRGLGDARRQGPR
jgi:hypothetical protein